MISFGMQNAVGGATFHSSPLGETTINSHGTILATRATAKIQLWSMITQGFSQTHLLRQEQYKMHIKQSCVEKVASVWHRNCTRACVRVDHAMACAGVDEENGYVDTYKGTEKGRQGEYGYREGN